MKYDIKTFTLEEKMKLLSGQTCWQMYDANGKVPEVFLSDGPHGLRMLDVPTAKEIDPNMDYPTKKATAMPALSVLANTWNPDLAYLDGQTIADECVEKGADVLLAPGVNMKRSPLCGRNFEYFSEDPFLAGTMAKAYIEGVQSKGVGTSLKHFCANNREYDRFFMTSEVDERTLREIYLPAFEIAVQAQPWTVMCAYNTINGVYASENKQLLTDVLREEFGFEGMVVSDWGAVHQRARSVKAGLDLEMPCRKEAYEELKEAYESGWITEAEIDACAERVLRLIEKTQNDKKAVTMTKEARHENALKIAREGIVLLKNEDNILPLKGGKIAVNGYNIMNESPFYSGGGSACTETEYKGRPLDQELAERLGEKAEIVSREVIFGGDGHLWHGNLAIKAAYVADTVVLSVGTGPRIELESKDRTNIKLPQTQVDLLLNVAKVNPNVVVVVTAGSAIDMSEWIDKVKAVVYLGFAGEAGMEAVADVLTGKVCPSGKLNETFPIDLESVPVGKYEGNGFVDRYTEGLFIGYRYYDSYQKEVRFPFGYGLSYATFEYSDLKLEKKSETDYEVSFNVTNTSDVDGKEISQIYVRDVFATVTRPEKELKGFAKTELKAGETKRVCVKLCSRAFAFYNVALKKWFVENGAFEILVGSSSRDIRLVGKIDVELPKEEQYTLA